MDFYKDLRGLALEFAANGKNYDLSVEEMAIYGNNEVYHIYDYAAEARQLLVVSHAALDRDQARQIKVDCSNPAYLKEIVANPATRAISIAGDADMNGALLAQVLEGVDAAPPAAEKSAKAPEPAPNGMISSGPITFKL